MPLEVIRRPGRAILGPAIIGPAILGPANARPSVRVVRATLLLATAILVAACRTGGAIDPGGSSSSTAAPGGSSPSTASQAAGGPIGGPTGPTEDATLVRVVDGDTIRVIVGGVEERVRYIGINTPELYSGTAATPEPFAEAATEANRRLLDGGRLVLEKDVSERDRYDRLLRNIWIDRDGAWTFVNLVLVSEGYAQVSTFPPDVRYVDLLLAAQRAARDTRRGLWAAGSG